MKTRIIVFGTILALLSSAPALAGSISLRTNDPRSVEEYLKFAGYALWTDAPFAAAERTSIKRIWVMSIMRLFKIAPGEALILGIVKRRGEKPWIGIVLEAKPTREYAEALCADIRPNGAFRLIGFIANEYKVVCSDQKGETRRV